LTWCPAWWPWPSRSAGRASSPLPPPPWRASQPGQTLSRFYDALGVRAQVVQVLADPERVHPLAGRRGLAVALAVRPVQSGQGRDGQHGRLVIAVRRADLGGHSLVEAGQVRGQLSQLVQ